MSEMTERDIVSLLRSEAKDCANPVLKSGDHVGAWTVTAFLGGGGFGEVYRVVHLQVGLACALKLLKDLSEASRARFVLEARVLARQLHSGIPRFYETGEVNGRPYLVMELLDPRELPAKEQGIANLALRLCSICQSLHAAGLVHRDIKPANVLYRESGEVVLTDYGLVKRIDSGVSAGQDGDSQLTQVQLVMGTGRYVAPEQFVGEAASPFADIYAVGVLLNECFRGTIPRRWRRIICRATTSLPERRYRSMAELAKAIRYRFCREIFVLGFVMACAILVVVAFKCGGRTWGALGRHSNPESIVPRNVSESASEWLAE